MSRTLLWKLRLKNVNYCTVHTVHSERTIHLNHPGRSSNSLGSAKKYTPGRDTSATHREKALIFFLLRNKSQSNRTFKIRSIYSWVDERNTDRRMDDWFSVVHNHTSQGGDNAKLLTRYYPKRLTNFGGLILLVVEEYEFNLWRLMMETLILLVVPHVDWTYRVQIRYHYHQ